MMGKWTLYLLSLWILGAWSDKIPCPTPNSGKPSEKECNKLAPCTWNKVDESCEFLPNDLYGYTIASELKTNNGLEVDLKKHGDTLFREHIPNLRLKISHVSSDIVRVKIFDPKNKRYEVPINTPFGTSPTEMKYEVRINTTIEAPFSLQIVRNATGTAVFDTSLGGLSFEDHFLSITTKLASPDLFGFGEHSRSRLNHRYLPKGQTWGMFSQDVVGTDWEKDGINLYGVHPFYENVEDELGNTHGVLFLNSNAMEYVLLNNSLHLRSVGGILDFFIFMGPTPEEVIQQYTYTIGRPTMPAYWALGFQICRYGYRDLQHVKDVVERTKSLGIPQDVQYVDIDYMWDYMDFTVNQRDFGDLPHYINDMKTAGLRFILILDPAIDTERAPEEYPTYYSGKDHEAFITWENIQDVPPGDYQKYGQIMRGKVWPYGKSAFPNFMSSKTGSWWSQEIKDFHTKVHFDGLWIDMNEPSNLENLVCPHAIEENPPYHSLPAALSNNGKLSGKTLCMTGHHDEYKHYDVHSLYGLKQSEVTIRALRAATQKRGVVISRSTYPGSGQYTGHWLGDNVASWLHMKKSIIGMIEFNFFGIPYVGSDICGFVGEKDEEMCQRWIALGSFYPFSRSHNDKYYEDSDPAMWPDTVAVTAKETLGLRYRLLPYLYTLFYHAKKRGSTVVRPLFHVFPPNPDTLSIDDQFMWGSGIMISPVLEPNTTLREAYFPDKTLFYQFNQNLGSLVKGKGKYVEVKAPLTTIPIHIVGGHIIPMQQEELNTQLSIKNPYTLLIAPGVDGKADGDLFIDDGEVIDGDYSYVTFHYDKDEKTLTTGRKEGVYFDKSYFNTIILMHATKPTHVTVNGKEILFSLEYNGVTKRATIKLEDQLSIVASWKIVIM